jgi:P-type Ca2+ transporter type 2C
MNKLVGNSTKLPLVTAIHTAVRGRARYQVLGLQGSIGLKHDLEGRLATEVGIRSICASATSGNVLVLFEPTQTVAAIATLIQQMVTGFRDRGRFSRSTNTPMNSDPQPPRTEGKLPTSTPTDLDRQAEAWHLVETERILTNLQTSADSGLSDAAVRSNLQQYGLNLLPESTPRSKIGMFLDQFKSLPVGLLAVAAGVSVATGGLVDAMVIMGVVTINAAIGFATENQSDRIIRSLKQLVKPSAVVIRAGKLQEVSAEEIALGDLLVLRPGTYIAADARAIEAKRLSVDESALTGESLPVAKTSNVLTAPDLPLADRVNMVYAGTLVTGGQGLAVVVATGKFTEMGRIQTLVGTAIVPETPMQRQLDRAGSQLMLISSGVCGVVFGIGLLRGYGVLEMLKSSISLAVAAVPEGLPTIATTTLALGIRDMRKQKVLIRRLDAVEALGSMQSLCLDKTGTLTENIMSVVEVRLDNYRIQIQGGECVLKGGEILHLDGCEHLQKLLQVVVLCNECEIDGTGVRPSIHGSATESALMMLAIDIGVDVVSLRQSYPLLNIQHRSEERNFMLTLHENSHEQKFIAVKGNPIEVLSLCDWQLVDGQIAPLTDEQRQIAEIENERMAGKALRVLGIAYGQTEAATGSGERLVWLGLVGMADPIRQGVKAVVATFHQAGIDTIMITGDQSPTAYAIGKELNLSRGEQLQILDSTDLTNVDPEAIKSLCQSVHVFARISPANKLQIVQGLQRSGRIVAMTGDGINDAPALKAAEVGIAMGNTGTDVAREVADVVLEDDNLATMAIAISQGRTIYSNIQKSVHFLLSTNMSEIIVMFAGTALGIGQPLNAMQLLWLNLVTDIFPGLALGLEPPEPEIMTQPPRDPTEPIVGAADFRRIAIEATTLSASTLSAYGYGISRYGIGARASTIGFMSLTFAQLLHALSCRSQKRTVFSPQRLPPNQYLTLALGGSMTLQLLAAAIPGLRQLLKIAPISPLDLAVIAASALMPLLVNEATKPEESKLP